MKVLIVEDEADIADGLHRALTREGYVVEVANNGPLGEEMALSQSYSAILLDLMLPGKNGVEVCKSLRQHGCDTPVLMLTARDAVADRVAGLDSGADDYLAKPFALEELLARVRSLTRREAKVRSAVMEFGDLKLDTLGKTVHKAGVLIALTSREYELLESLARNAGRVLTRDAIIERVFQAEEILPNTVSFHMSSLRKKVDPENALIQTIHGLGYSLRPGFSESGRS